MTNMEPIEEAQELINLDLSEIKITDLNGSVLQVQDFNKDLGNKLFLSARTIELHEISKKIHAGEVIEINKEILQEIISILEFTPVFLPFAHIPLLVYLKSKLL